MVNDKVRTIRLYGPLGARFGRVHRMAVLSTAEAVRALCRMVPGFEKYMMNARDSGLTFAVFNGRRNLVQDDLQAPVGSEDIRIAPILIGAKSGGLFQTILGAALVVAGVLTSNPGLVLTGAGMALGGVMQMLSPQTSTSSNTSSSTASYYFSGAVNSTAQGDPVPLAYGRFRVGSKVASAGIYSEDQA